MSQHVQPIDAEAALPRETTGGLFSAVVRLYPALAVPEFRLLWFMSFPSTMTWSLCAVATGYAALTISGSATVLGIVTGLSGLPMLVLAPIGGVVADRFPRKNVIIVAQCILAAGALALAILSLLGIMEVWHLAALGLLQGVAFSFNMPARQSLLMEVVGPKLTRSAAALNTAAPNFSRVVGPSVAGIMLATPGIGVSGVFVTMCIMYAIVFVSLLRLPPSAKPPAAGSGMRAVWDSLLEGFRYILSSAVHRGLLGTAFVLLILGAPVLQIMPVFSEHVFNVGATGLGMLLSANGIGALIGSVGVAAVTGFRRLGLIQVGFGFAFALSIVGFSLAPSLSMAVVMIGLFGAAQSCYMSLNSTMLMGNTEPRMYGRVLSVYLMTFAVTPIAAMPLAWLTDVINPQTATLGAGLAVLAAVVILAVASPATRTAR
ncbi:MAG: MFS transporter [Chloroflexi bacterium]|nr:MFS transporter [Chloroflexota bacterium]